MESIRNKCIYTAITVYTLILLSAMWCFAHSFSDVKSDSYYADAVEWAVEKGITHGASATVFAPESTCTRGQVAAFLWRAKGSPEPSIQNCFDDIDVSNPFYKAILWAYENEVTAGAGENTFAPDEPCTNAQVVTFLWRANGRPNAVRSDTIASGYQDDAYYKEAVAWADSVGLFYGIGKNFEPYAASPRSDIVTYIYRFMNGPAMKKELYSYVVSETSYSHKTANLICNSTQGWAHINYLHGDAKKPFRVLRIYNNQNAGGGLPLGERMTIDFPNMPDVDTSEYGAVHLSFKYCYVSESYDVNVGYVNKLEVLVSTDNGNSWKPSRAGMISNELIGNITTDDNRKGVIYEVTADDITSLVEEGEIITDIRLKPYGDYYHYLAAFRLAEVHLTAYDRPLSGTENQIHYITVPERKLRDIVCAQIMDITSAEWVCDSEINTMNYNTVNGVSTEAPMKYYAGYLHKGPLYTRVENASAERVRSTIKDGKYIGGIGINDAVGMSCSRIVIDATSRIASGNTHYTIGPMLCDIENMPLVEPLSNDGNFYTTTDKIIAAYSAEKIYQHYANSKPGDVAVSIPVGQHLRLVTSEATVVYNEDGSIDPDISYLLMTESGGTVYYYWKKPDGSTVRIKQDPAVTAKAYPQYTFLYGASCRVNEKYTFAQLKKTEYIILTLEEYKSERIEELSIRAKPIYDPAEYAKNGFEVAVQSNYRLIDMRVKLSDSSGNVIYENRKFPLETDFEAVFCDEALNTKLKYLEKGNYSIAFSVTSGPVTEIGGSVPVTEVLDIDFAVRAN